MNNTGKKQTKWDTIETGFVYLVSKTGNFFVIFFTIASWVFLSKKMRSPYYFYSKALPLTIQVLFDLLNDRFDEEHNQKFEKHTKIKKIVSFLHSISIACFYLISIYEITKAGNILFGHWDHQNAFYCFCFTLIWFVIIPIFGKIKISKHSHVFILMIARSLFAVCWTNSLEMLHIAKLYN